MSIEPPFNSLTGHVVLRITVHTDGWSVEAEPPMSPDDMTALNPLLQFVAERGNERIALATAPRACVCGNITKLEVTHHADRMCTSRVNLDDNHEFHEWLEAEIERRVAERMEPANAE